MVLMKAEIGGTRVLDVMFGEQLPRICRSPGAIGFMPSKDALEPMVCCSKYTGYSRRSYPQHPKTYFTGVEVYAGAGFEADYFHDWLDSRAKPGKLCHPEIPCYVAAPWGRVDSRAAASRYTIPGFAPAVGFVCAGAAVAQTATAPAGPRFAFA
jgi:hypothetical protein